MPGWPETLSHLRKWDTQSKCAMKNVVYKITCKMCETNRRTESYIGECSRPVRYRFNEHLGDARLRRPDTPLGEHITDFHLDASNKEINTGFNIEIISSGRDNAEIKIIESLQIRNLKPTLNVMRSSWPLVHWMCILGPPHTGAFTFAFRHVSLRLSGSRWVSILFGALWRVYTSIFDVSQRVGARWDPWLWEASGHGRLRHGAWDILYSCGHIVGLMMIVNGDVISVFYMCLYLNICVITWWICERDIYIFVMRWIGECVNLFCVQCDEAASVFFMYPSNMR